MVGENKDNADVPDNDSNDTEFSEAEAAETVVLNEDNIGDMSVEINVEELVATIEGADDDGSEHRREVKRRLEKLREEKEQNLDSTYNFNLDEDL